MRALIITGGLIDAMFAEAFIRKDSWDLVISADAGMEFCRQLGLLPDCLMGDFDSAAPETLSYFRKICPERFEVFPAHKDETDTELALMRAIEAGADEITLLGATGTRMDHVLGNIQLLKKALDAGVQCLLVDAHNRIRIIDDALILKKSEQFGHYVSLLPFTPCVRGLTLSGFAYEVTDVTLHSGQARGVSNEIAAREAQIKIKEGELLVIESKD